METGLILAAGEHGQLTNQLHTYLREMDSLRSETSNACQSAVGFPGVKAASKALSLAQVPPPPQHQFLPSVAVEPDSIEMETLSFSSKS